MHYQWSDCMDIMKLDLKFVHCHFWKLMVITFWHGASQWMWFCHYNVHLSTMYVYQLRFGFTYCLVANKQALSVLTNCCPMSQTCAVTPGVLSNRPLLHWDPVLCHLCPRNILCHNIRSFVGIVVEHFHVDVAFATLAHLKEGCIACWVPAVWITGSAVIYVEIKRWHFGNLAFCGLYDFFRLIHLASLPWILQKVIKYTCYVIKKSHYIQSCFWKTLKY